MPFTIPGKWKWTVIGSVVTLISGRDLEKNQILENDLGVPYITGASQIQDQVIIVNRWTNSPSVFSELGDVLLTCKGTVGKITINNIGKVHIARQIMSLRPCKEIDKKYLAYYLMSIVKFLINHAKSMIPGIDRKTVLGMSIPVPPFAEQHRIVSKLNQVFDQIDHAEKAYNELSGPLSESFRQLCLEKAIQGKIVPQLESEPGVEQIGEAPENVPFAIPEKWKWLTIKEITEKIIGGGTPSKGCADYWNGDIPWASVKDLKGDVLSNTKDHITQAGLDNSSSKLIQKGTIIICVRMGLGKISINSIDIAINQDLKAIFIKENIIDKKYFFFFYKSLSIKGSGSTVMGIKTKDLLSIPIPIPPLDEQRRIVAKLNKLLSSVAQIESSVSTL